MVKVNSSTSEAWFDRAKTVLAGGVSSPVRAFKSVGGTPRVIASAEGSQIRDVDGRVYLDFVNSWGPLILGHAHPAVSEAICAAAKGGSSYGAPCRPEIELAELVKSMYPGIDLLRFVSSGTEAVMSAVRLARGATGRDVIVKFSGCYHGHVDSLLVAAGSGLVTFGEPSSAGVPPQLSALSRVVPLDDEARLNDLCEREGSNIAAIVIEPIPANNGLLLQRPEFLRSLRRICDRHGIVLIFDEVISGFRVAPGGAAEVYGVTPDLVTFGKVIGGGLPVGAFGGRRDLMENLSPLGRVYQAGTLSGNPVAMAAGLATLKTLIKEDGWRRLVALGAQLEQQVGAVLGAQPRAHAFIRSQSIFWMALLAETAPRTDVGINSEAAGFYAMVFHEMLHRGIALAPSAFEVGFLSLAHNDKDITRFAAMLHESLLVVERSQRGKL